VIRRRIAAIDREVGLSNLQSLRELVERASWRDQLLAVLFVIFAVLAVILAAAGLFAVLSYAIGQQTREIAIRMALGASRSRIRAMVFARAGILIVSGSAVGVLFAIVMARLAVVQIYAVSPYDPATYAEALSILVVAAILATIPPTRRATRLSPSSALRS
jgi:ABC-type antimicrobial peptide transport system permease subunit